MKSEQPQEQQQKDDAQSEAAEGGKTSAGEDSGEG